jgi:hypothetical protein
MVFFCEKKYFPVLQKYLFCTQSWRQKNISIGKEVLSASLLRISEWIFSLVKF